MNSAAVRQLSQHIDHSRQVSGNAPGGISMPVMESQIFIGLNDSETKQQKLSTDRYAAILKEVCKDFGVPFSFNVIDGGYKTETANFLSYLKTVTGQEQPHVDLWFLTHPHGDHCQVFYELIENQPEALTYDTVCLKFAPVGFYVGIDSEAEYLVGEYERLHPLFADKEYIPADGDRFSVGAARFTMLYTFDPSFTRCNESSLVFRMELGGKSVLFTGDIAFNAAYKMMNNPEYAPLLDCDVCKMAHHGQDAVNRDFYEVVTPEICLWPTPSWLWTNLNGTGPYTTLETREWVEDLGVAKSVIKMDGSFVLFLNETADM